MSNIDEADVDEDVEMKDEDSFSNSADASSDEEDADEEKINEIQKRIEASPYTYDLHVQLISLCRKLGDLDKLRAAREKMSELFPLTPELWLDWLNDEKTLAVTSEQKEHLTQLFERAVKDYAAVSVWLEYVQFAIGKIGETWKTGGLEIIRQTFEKAVTAVGIHVTQGYLIWEAYKEFESVYFLTLQSRNASEEELKEQEKRIYSIYKRQLSIPLIGMDKTYEEFREKFDETSYPDITEIDYAYKRALKKLNNIQQYEEALMSSEAPHYEEYKTYIQYEKGESEPIRVQNLYERALIENCLKDELWLEYTKFMDYNVKIRDMSLSVYERAVRNCPWCVQLWASYGRALERYEEPHEKIVGNFETALSMGFAKAEDFKELWLAYLDYLRRRISTENVENNENVTGLNEVCDVFDRAVTQMQHYFRGSESEYVIMKYWIFFTVKYKKDIESARNLWKELIDHGHREEARVWLDYVNFERLYGDATHYRKALFRALLSVNDWQETFVDLWITFEREEGSLESLEKSLSMCETQMQRINEKRIKKMEEVASNLQKESKRGGKYSSRQQQKGNKNENINKTDSKIPVQMDSEGFKIPPPPDRIHSADIKNEDHSDVQTGRKRAAEDNDTLEVKRKKVETSESHGTTVRHDSSKDDRTVFLSNLAYNIEEEKIRECFSQVAEIEEIRLVRDYKGRSKGFCYVVYKSPEDAKKALEKDREMLDGRPVLVSPCEDRKNNPSSQPKFKFGTGLERNKLFIKGLPFSTTKEDLEKMFKEYGTLKDVRLVTYRNGHSKGLAYVEFEDEAAAANAVVKTDGTKILDHVISVAISNPPPRKNKSVKFSSVTVSESLGGGSTIKGPRGRGRTQISLLPRSVLRPPVGKKNLPSSSKNMQNGQNSEVENSSEDRKPLTNSDFAEMLSK